MDNQMVLKALYENRKEFLTVNYRIHGENIGYGHAYMYAVAWDMYPYFHSTHNPEEGIEDPFYPFYKITESQMREVISFLDKEWLEKKMYSFYDIENRFGGKEKRGDLISILRYVFLDGRFDAAFWEKVNSWGPVEAGSITSEKSKFDI